MGKQDKELVGLAAEYVFDLFRHAKSRNTLVFHGFKRTKDVVVQCREIAKGAKLDDREIPIVLLAAWFHDAAYAVTADGDRRKGIELARAFLARHGASKDLIESVVTCIESAQSPAHDQPVHEVLHDALLSPLADKDLLRQAELFRLEQERRTGKRLPEVEWTRQCIQYVESHHYRTRWAQLEYDGKREANLIKLYKLLREQQEAADEQKAEEAKALKGAGKTVENVFYFLSKMTVQVMVLADRRTSTMIHVNAIMISAVVALLLRRVDEQRFLLVPTLVLLSVNLMVIFVAIYSMRLQPRRHREGAQAGKVFVFDPSVPLSPEEYRESMTLLAQDGAMLQSAMIDQLYFSRSVLGERARALRLTYDFFIYGLALSLAVFAFVLIRR